MSYSRYRSTGSTLGTAAGAGCGLLLCQLATFVTIVCLLGIWTDRNLDFWLTQLKGSPVDVPYFLSCLASLPVPLTFLLNVIAEIARLCV